MSWTPRSSAPSSVRARRVCCVWRTVCGAALCRALTKVPSTSGVSSSSPETARRSARDTWATDASCHSNSLSCVSRFCAGRPRLSRMLLRVDSQKLVASRSCNRKKNPPPDCTRSRTWPSRCVLPEPAVPRTTTPSGLDSGCRSASAKASITCSSALSWTPGTWKAPWACHRSSADGANDRRRDFRASRAWGSITTRSRSGAGPGCRSRPRRRGPRRSGSSGSPRG